MKPGIVQLVSVETRRTITDRYYEFELNEITRDMSNGKTTIYPRSLNKIRNSPLVTGMDINLSLKIGFQENTLSQIS